MREKSILTRCEFQVMSILWNLPAEGGFTSEILEKYEDPKPAYTTLATFLKILSNKGFVKIQKHANKLYYIPIVSKEEYAEVALRPAKDTYFEGSITKLFSFFLEKEQLSAEQVEDITQMLRAAQK